MRWIEDRVSHFLKKFDTTNFGCWVWNCGKDREGYGNFWNGERSIVAHKYSYEYFINSVSEELELDHLCRNRACVNPEHLEPLTHKENVNRGNLGKTSGLREKSKTHCKQGHPYSVENTTIKKDGKRLCRKCSREWNRRQRVKRRNENRNDRGYSLTSISPH